MRKHGEDCVDPMNPTSIP